MYLHFSENRLILEVANKMRKKKTIRAVNSICNMKSPAVAPIQGDDKNRKVSSVVRSLLLPGQRRIGRIAIFDR